MFPLKDSINHTNCNGRLHPSKVINCLLSPQTPKKKKIQGWRPYKTYITQQKLMYGQHKITRPFHYLYRVSKNIWKELITDIKKKSENFNRIKFVSDIINKKWNSSRNIQMDNPAMSELKHISIFTLQNMQRANSWRNKALLFSYQDLDT